MFVNKIPFLLTISRNVRFITDTALNNRTEKSIVAALKEIHGIYRKRGFRITNVLGDGEFECTRGFVANDLKSELNICGEDEHVPDIERCVRAVKERTRCTYNVTPFDKFPPKMISEMVMLSIFWLNAFPHRLGISQTMSPRNMIVTGLDVDYTKHCRIEYGQYVQTHEQHDNSMNTRTVGALALRPTGNQQGGYYFYSLSTGRRLHRTHWTELPMPDDVKDRVHALARRARASRRLTFTDSDGTDLDTLYPDEDDTNNNADDDESDDSTYDPNNADDNSDDESNDSDDGDSDYSPTGDSDDDSYDISDATPDQPLPVPTPVEPGGMHNTGKQNQQNDNPRNVGVATKMNETDNVDNTDLEAYVNELETELDKEIAELE
jgi:hypothetical protein